MQEEISLLELFQLAKKYLFLMIVLSIVGAILSGAFMFGFVDSTYKSEAQLIVNQKSKKKEEAIQYTDLQTSINLINTYSDIITSESLLDQVASQLDFETTAGELKKALSVEQSQNSQSFIIRAVMDNPDNARKVVDKITVLFEETLKDIYKEDISNIYVLSKASYNPNRVSPSLTRYLLIGAILGLLMAILIGVIREISDNTVRDTDFLISLGLINLGEVNELSKKERKAALLGNRRVDKHENEGEVA